MQNSIIIFISGLAMGIIFTLIGVYVPTDTILTVYKLGLIPSISLTLLAIIMSGKYKSAKNKKENDHINKPGQPRGTLEERYWVLIFTNFAPLQTIILVGGSWISSFYLGYLLVEYINKKK